ncbi:hypothetical protein G7Y89_g1907 [Cudoniella acicularis]|uniref:Uncharacterized protein n=1 Tax=Cudoniella acicularis TaxID=354080 RepID=A0A8H4RVG3_9HELO|nr:hypothetical protein G7Y89_g1907 [Cudoniella acicularis]
MSRGARSNRERNDPYNYGRPASYHYEDLVFDHAEHWFNRDGFNTPAYRSRDNDHRLGENRILVPFSRRSGAMSGFEDSRRRGRGGLVQNQNIPFGTAMINLYRVLGEAEQVYQNFKSEYDRAIESSSMMINYLPDDLLTAIWRKMLAAKKYKNTFSTQQNSMEQLEKFTQKFADAKDNVMRAMECALKSTIKEADNSQFTMARLNSSIRLQQKVEVSNHHIRDLMESAPEGRHHCVALLVELDRLKTLINPADENNSKLYAVGDDESGAEEFSKQLQGYENTVCQCHNCGNYSARVIKRNPWFTFCFIPVIPLSIHGYEDVVCSICNFAQPLQNRPDVIAQMNGGGGMPLQNNPQGGPPPGWGGGGPPKQQQNMRSHSTTWACLRVMPGPRRQPFEVTGGVLRSIWISRTGLVESWCTVFAFQALQEQT